MIAIPGDVFYHGSLLFYIPIVLPVMALLATTVYIPVFRKLDITSIFEVKHKLMQLVICYRCF